MVCQFLSQNISMVAVMKAMSSVTLTSIWAMVASTMLSEVLPMPISMVVLRYISDTTAVSRGFETMSMAVTTSVESLGVIETSTWLPHDPSSKKN